MWADGTSRSLLSMEINLIYILLTPTRCLMLVTQPQFFIIYISIIYLYIFICQKKLHYLHSNFRGRINFFLFAYFSDYFDIINI